MHPQQTLHRANLVGIAWMTTAMAAFAVEDAFIKAATGLGAGVNESGDALLVALPGEISPLAPKLLLMVTVSDYAAFAASVGGDASGELEPDDSQMSLPIQPAPAPPPRPVPMPQPARVRTVPKDEYGFPIVQASGMDAGSVLAEAIDDDGVPQI